MSQSKRVDVVIIGAGHNGLVCAFYLARAGYETLVLERSDRIGGAAITEEFHPGFRNSVASYTVSLLAPKIIADMALEQHGLRVLPRPVANFVPSHDNAGLELHHDTRRSCEAIRAISPRDAERFVDFAGELAGIVELLRPLLLEAPLDPFGGWRQWLRGLKALPRARAMLARPALGVALWSMLTGSAGHWLDRWFESDLLKGGLGFDSIVGHYASPYAAGSGYLLLHHGLGQSHGIQGAWGHAVGGMGAVSEAMAAAARAAGVDIETNEPVTAIARDAGDVVVTTSLGRELRARVVGAAVHPQLLYTRLVDAASLPEEFVTQMRSWRSESASFRLNVALAELPQFTCRPGKMPQAIHGAGILIAPSLAYLDAAYVDARACGHSRSPVVELLIPSTLDASLAPSGGHVASLFCQHFPYRRPDGVDWETAKQAAIDAILDAVDAYAPNFRNAIVGIQALSPRDLENRFGLVGGDIFHGQMTLDQLYWSRPALRYCDYRSPLAGLYLCGSGAHPGGGVSGAPGHNAAAAMLHDLQSRAL